MTKDEAKQVLEALKLPSMKTYAMLKQRDAAIAIMLLYVAICGECL